MNKIRQGFIVAALAALPMANAAAAEGDFSATIGLKAWVNNWNSWNQTRSGELANFLDPIVQNIESSNTDGWIPSFSMRYQNFLVGGSYFAKRGYDFGSHGFVDVKREEFDLSAGYYVLPTLAIIAGYKEVDQWFGDKFKYSGPIIGFSASAPLTGGFSLYGTAAFGPMDAELPTASGIKKVDASYRLGEVGVAYVFDTGGSAGMKSVIGTLGYRSQAIVTKFDGTWSGQKGRDTTEGITIGIAAAF